MKAEGPRDKEKSGNKTAGFYAHGANGRDVDHRHSGQLAVPKFKGSIQSAREAVLQEDLHTMRDAIDSYKSTGQAKVAQSLYDLVQHGYLLATYLFIHHRQQRLVGHRYRLMRYVLD